MTARATTDRRHQVLAALRGARGPLTVAELAAQLAVHPNTVRFHLEALVGAGQVEHATAPHAGTGRPPAGYAAVPRMDPHGERRYDVLAAVLAAELAHEPDAGARAEAAGRAWGARQAAGFFVSGGQPASDVDATAALVAMLDGLGFSPEPPERSAARPTAVGLRSCPFLELATSSPVVCPVHLGLMRGALDAWGSALTVERLEPFAEPDLCLAHLGAVRSGARERPGSAA